MKMRITRKRPGKKTEDIQRISLVDEEGYMIGCISFHINPGFKDHIIATPPKGCDFAVHTDLKPERNDAGYWYFK